jgi:hypothetical protein
MRCDKAPAPKRVCRDRHQSIIRMEMEQYCRGCREIRQDLKAGCADGIDLWDDPRKAD